MHLTSQAFGWDSDCSDVLVRWIICLGLADVDVGNQKRQLLLYIYIHSLEDLLQ